MRQYLVVRSMMSLKIDGEVVDFPDPIPPEMEPEIARVWKEYDAKVEELGYAPFMFYSSVKSSE